MGGGGGRGVGRVLRTVQPLIIIVSTGGVESDADRAFIQKRA